MLTESVLCVYLAFALARRDIEPEKHLNRLKLYLLRFLLLKDMIFSTKDITTSLN